MSLFLDSSVISAGEKEFPPLRPEACVPSTYEALTAPKRPKVLISGRMPGDPAILVNPLQAKRMVIMRRKKFDRMMDRLRAGKSVNPELESTRFSKGRVKDRSRQRVALARKRINGLFVNKHRELLLEGNLSDESETCEPEPD